MGEISMENPAVARINHKERVSDTGAAGSGGDQLEMADMVFAKRGCCLWVPCLGSRFKSSSRSESAGLVWSDYRTADNSSSDERWWTKGWNALKNVREWSEIMAGPKWKTFIRRFNRNKNGGCCGGGGGGARSGKFQYDPLSYALNFDEGPGQNGLLDDDFAYRDFSSRYAAIPMSGKSSMDLGKDGPSFDTIREDYSVVSFDNMRR